MRMQPEIEPAINQPVSRYSRNFWLVTLTVSIVLLLIAIFYFLTR
jgi:hypothetical protein